jgi:hypothetical protein
MVIPGAGAHALSMGWGVVCGGLTSFSRRPASLHFSLPPQPVRAAVWQPALWIRTGLEPQMNTDEHR